MDCQSFLTRLNTHLSRIRVSISKSAYRGWKFSTHAHLTQLQLFLEQTLQNNASLLPDLTPVLDTLLFHASDVFRYFWAPLTDSRRPEDAILEPITATCSLLSFLFSSKLGPTTAVPPSDAALYYLFESLLPYLVIHWDGLYASFPSDKQLLSHSICCQIYDFTENLLSDGFKGQKEASEAPETPETPETQTILTPSSLFRIWTQLLRSYLTPTYRTTHFCNYFTRKLFTYRGSRLPEIAVKMLAVWFIEQVLACFLDRLKERDFDLLTNANANTEGLSIEALLIDLLAIHGVDPSSPLPELFLGEILTCSPPGLDGSLVAVLQAVAGAPAQTLFLVSLLTEHGYAIIEENVAF